MLGTVPQNREGGIFVFWFSANIRRVERHTGLARVNIEVQNQEFRGQGAKIDLAIGNQIGGIFCSMSFGRRAARFREIHVDLSIDKGLEGLQADDAGLRHARVQTARDIIPRPIPFAHMKSRLEFVNRDEAAALRESGAFGVAGRDPDIETRIRHGFDGKEARKPSGVSALAGA